LLAASYLDGDVDLTARRGIRVHLFALRWVVQWTEGVLSNLPESMMSDAYDVPCPSCLAHVGEPCWNRRRHLAFAHLTRRRTASRRSLAHARREMARTRHLLTGTPPAT
jgi:hypothetical protein